MEFTCENIGLTQEELQERVVRGLVERILGEDHGDPESHVHRAAYKAAMEHVKTSVNDAVNAVAEKHVYPMAEKLITDHIFQETNQWGEAKGEARTFIEYLEERASGYFAEQINIKGKAHRECSQYDQRDWKPAGSRIAVMIDECLTSQIKEALDAAVENVHMTLAEGLTETTRRVLKKVAAATEVATKVR